MRDCHISMKTGDEALTRLAFWLQAGHSYSGMDNMAMAGVNKANVPPCRMGSLNIGTGTERSDQITFNNTSNVQN